MGLNLEADVFDIYMSHVTHMPEYRHTLPIHAYGALVCSYFFANKKMWFNIEADVFDIYMSRVTHMTGCCHTVIIHERVIVTHVERNPLGVS